MIGCFGICAAITRTLIRAVFAIALVGLLSCEPPSAPSARNSTPSSIAGRTDADARDRPIRDLSQDEDAGGHILRKHVGQSDDQLRERLEREPRITGASTYTDRDAAEHAVGAAIGASQDRIQSWLSRSGGHSNLVLDYDSPTPIGRTINRGESQPHPCAHALVVLKYFPPNHYYVLTSYPECRP
jgi:hypothetical protein